VKFRQIFDIMEYARLEKGANRDRRKREPFVFLRVITLICDQYDNCVSCDLFLSINSELC